MLPELAEKHSHLYKVRIPRSTDRAVLLPAGSILSSPAHAGRIEGWLPGNILRKVRKDVER